ncbi:MFS transporter [Aurantiacibacter hainanensis]|uniref:MFS transporter n=1 Tax=Aurantiacibacter hainanensis TaxID=3076114 RepID=UPI0030C690D7
MPFSAAIADAPLRPFQIVVAVFGLTLLVIDGVDLQSLSLVTPLILDEWSIDRALFGPALAASLFGMGFGSILGGLLGDRIGRLNTLFIASLIFGSTTIAAAYTNTVWEMSVVRMIGGLGFGAAYPNALALVSDWVSARHRPHAIALLSVGIPVGITVSAEVLPLLLPDHGWRGAFVIFGVGSLIFGVIMRLVLREPPAFLLAKGKPDAAHKSAARVLEGDFALAPEPEDELAERPGERIGIFHARNKRLNIAMVVSFSAATTLVYGLLNWTTELLTSAGFTLEQALRATSWQGILSVIGGVSAGLLVRTFGSRAMILGAATGITATIMALAWMVEGLSGPPSASQITTIVALEGLAVGLVSMTISMFYVVMAQGYPSACRSGGIGFVITSGRVFSIAMVFAGGWLLNLGGDSFLWYFAVLLAVALLVFPAAWIIDCHIEPVRRKEQFA